MSKLPLAGVGKLRRPVNVLIRAEDPSRVWERRVPLTPDAVYSLTSKGKANVYVVPSAKRVFKDIEYSKAGAKLTLPTGTAPDIVLGIKEPPVSEVVPASSPHSTHFMFSHTAKGQSYNTPLLAKFLDPKSTNYRLVDFELITDNNGKRTVGFGWHAGVAGVFESLSSMAQSHLEIGVATPFLYTPRPHSLPSLAKLREALREIGRVIATEGTPPQLGPFIFGLTGTGRVAEGCLSILKELPIEFVSVDSLPEIVKLTGDALKKIYIVHAKPSDYLVRADGGKYNREHYYDSPHSYTSVFAEKIAPYLTLFLNGTGWSPSFPRLMSNDQLPIALARAQNFGGARFTNIGDISCDVEGGLEFLTKATTLSSPFYKVRTPGLPADLPSVQMMSVDILPASIPLDASKGFSEAFLPYLMREIEYQKTPDILAYPAPLEQATIAENGILKERHAWLLPSVQKFFAQTQESVPEATPTATPVAHADTITKPSEVHHKRKHKILLLGSGMVAQPAVDLFASRPDVELVIGSNSLVELQALVAPHTHVKYRIVNIEDRNSYEHLVRDSDVVVSLLPATMHPTIAVSCIANGTHLVTASYISPAMMALNSKAKEANVVLLNEIGLDPGIDHCTAMELLQQKKSENKSIESFTSFCGGLPAPEDSGVPLRYKFSWRPLGVLSAALNSASYRLNWKKVVVPSHNLLSSYFPDLPITPDFKLEGIPNRDSLHYIDYYNLGRTTTLSTFVRGTLRYPGFSNLMNSFKKLGFLNDRAKMQISGWETFLPHCLSMISDSKTLPPLSSIIEPEELQPLQDALQWLGLIPPPVFDPSLTRPAMPPLPEGPLAPIEIFAYLLGNRLSYAPHERDMVVLAHEVITRTGNLRERTTSTLITYATQRPHEGFRGERPASAMARTVGIPVALAALRIAESKEAPRARGVIGPVLPWLYKPLLSDLAEVGIFMQEKTIPLEGRERTMQTALASAGPLRATLSKVPQVDPNAYDLDQDPKWVEEQKLA